MLPRVISRHEVKATLEYDVIRCGIKSGRSEPAQIGPMSRLSIDTCSIPVLDWRNKVIDSLHPSVVEALSNEAPIVMLNLMKFRMQSLDGNGSGWDAYLRYSRLAIQDIKSRGGSIIWTGEIEGTALGSVDHGDWDYAALVYYPTPAAFLDMMTSDAYGVANIHRENGCIDHLILATRQTYAKLSDVASAPTMDQ